MPVRYIKKIKVCRAQETQQTLLSGLSKRIDEQFNIPAHRIQNGAGTALLAIFLDLSLRFLWGARGRNAVDQLFRHQVLGAANLLLGSWPTQNGLYLGYH